LLAPHHVFSEYRKWRNNWDDLCNRCGQCCYKPKISIVDQKVVVRHTEVCEYLDLDSHLCKVFENRFAICKKCNKVKLFDALFSPILPKDCAYAQTFRGTKKTTGLG